MLNLSLNNLVSNKSDGKLRCFNHKWRMIFPFFGIGFGRKIVFSFRTGKCRIHIRFWRLSNGKRNKSDHRERLCRIAAWLAAGSDVSQRRFTHKFPWRPKIVSQKSRQMARMEKCAQKISSFSAFTREKPYWMCQYGFDAWENESLTRGSQYFWNWLYNFHTDTPPVYL